MSIRKLVIAIYLCCFAWTAMGWSSTPSPEITALLQRYQLQPETVGIDIRRLQASGVASKLLQWNQRRLLNPASTIKIITTAAALHRLGPSYRFKTDFYVDGRLTHGVLKGNLYIKGYGDPSMVSEQLWRAAMDLHDRGLHEIEGDVVGDDSFVERTKMHRDFSRDIASNSSGGALSLNYNHIQVWVHPTEVGKSTRVAIDPPVDEFIRLRNRSRTTAGAAKNLFIQLKEKKNYLELVIDGELGRLAAGVQAYRPVAYPSRYYLAAFKQLFMQTGGKIGGRLKRARVPATAELFYEKESEAYLSQILILLNKYSNNFIADQLVMTLGGLSSKDRTTESDKGVYQRGMDYLNNFLKQIGIQRRGALIVSGSGLSRQNRLSAQQLTDALLWSIRNPSVQPELVASLSIFGNDGTTKDRPGASQLGALIRAKTGSLDGVLALSGIMVPHKTTTPLVFTILINQAGLQKPSMEQFQLDLLKLAMAKAAAS